MVIGYTTGVFDMFHVGHLNLLRNAKERCDYLIVGVSTDKLVLEQKKVNLLVPYNERQEIVSALRCVDKVVPQTSYNKLEAWRKYSFNRMFVGDDWQGTDRWNELEKVFCGHGVEVVYLTYTRDISSTKLRIFIEENYKESMRP